MGQLIDEDVEHLRLLKFGFYILAALSGSMTLVALLYASVAGVLFSVISMQPRARGGLHLPVSIPLLASAIGGGLLLIGAAATFLTWYTGKSLGERQHHTLCMVVAGFCCLQVPFGSLIGVCALIVLSRPSVKELFEPRARTH